ncbi:MAG: hypothetical protein GEU79_18870 [Acidimicrobiia bacterium]|nr:hypothetical protein [Acidimicrobiia bacterium]
MTHCADSSPTTVSSPDYSSTTPDRWVLKGGAGLLTRLADAARHSQDLDLFYQGQQAAAVDDIMTAAHLELGDWFDFEIGTPKPIGGVHKGQQLPVTALLDGKEFSRFTVDTVVAVNITQPPEPAPPLSPVSIPELPTTTYILYSLVDHIADKHAAMLQEFGGKASSRYRDLVDLVLIAESQPISASPLQTALLSEYAHRGLTPPKQVSLPTEEWVAGYAAEVKNAPAAKARTAHDALQLVSAFLNPILTSKSSGNWDPNTATWTDGD